MSAPDGNQQTPSAMDRQISERSPLLPNSHTVPQTVIEEVSESRLWTILSATWIGSFLGALDTTIVATLLGHISSQFNQANEASWLGTSYLVSLTVFTPLYGRVSDITGRRFALLFACSTFFLGTLGCAFAQSLPQFVLARLIAGMGGGGLPSMSSIVSSDLVPLKKRGVIQGYANLFYGSGAALGGPLGGLISERFGWRWAFYIQLPFIALSFVMVAKRLTYHHPPQADFRQQMAQIDWLGAFFLMVSVGCLTTSMSLKANEQLPFSDKMVWVPAVVFLLAAFAFVVTELRVNKPILRLRVLVQRTPSFALLLNFLSAGAAFGLIYTYPLFFETVHLLPSSQAGARLLPFSVSISAGSLGAGFIMRRTGKYKRQLVIATALVLLAMITLCTPLGRAVNIGDWLQVIPAGLGYGALLTSSLVALIRAADRSDMAMSTSMSYLFRYSGQLIGVAMSSALLQEVLSRQLTRRITGPGASDLIEKIRRDSSSLPQLPKLVREAAVDSYSSATQAVFIFLAAIAFGAFLCSLPMQELVLPASFKEEEQFRQADETEPDE